MQADVQGHATRRPGQPRAAQKGRAVTVGVKKCYAGLLFLEVQGPQLSGRAVVGAEVGKKTKKGPAKSASMTRSCICQRREN